jgi:hypothetical protein
LSLWEYMRDSNEQITLLTDVPDGIENGTIFYQSSNHFPPAVPTTECIAYCDSCQQSPCADCNLCGLCLNIISFVAVSNLAVEC